MEWDQNVNLEYVSKQSIISGKLDPPTLTSNARIRLLGWHRYVLDSGVWYCELT